jgi:hypothetical protein
LGNDQIGIMSEEKKAPEERKRIRMTSVLAAALAAVTAALLGSTLGVAGTVIGAGVASVVSTVGGELYLRSLQQTRDAAKKAMELAGRRSRTGLTPATAGEPAPGQGGPGSAPTVYLSTDLSNMPTVRLSELRRGANGDEQPTELIEPEHRDSLGEKLRKMRWPLIIGSSAVAFVAALVVLLTIEWGTKGGVSTGLIPRPDTSQHQDTPADKNPTSTEPQAPPTTDSKPDNQTAPATTPSAPPSSRQQESQEQRPSSTGQPSTSQAPTSTQAPTSAGPPSNAAE